MSWELDSLGINSPSEKKSKLELQDLALKHFENTVLRVDEGRYIVSIPWIEENEKLEDHYSLAKGRLEKTVKTLKFTGRLFDYEQVFVDLEKEGILLKRLHKMNQKVCIESNFDFQDNQQKSDQQEIQVLGLMWNVKKDTFPISYRETESKEEVTKRRIFSLAHRIVDPIGFTCPITLIPKLLIQECWKIEASWDSKLPIDIERKFETRKKQLIEIQDLKVPQRLSNLDLKDTKDTNLSLQVFCDASKLSYATCVFLRVER
ncbi:uncharacterized protein TNIN_299831 [Trichonephila inaurata madagascariensis]|uniref:Uncharacterized protein n=1 Tax=Trichonephila inaurata madagascariensis TaxID=2747483 RepID=A0A8X6WM46_9ARAC|nr:uncharacterized protein TNIN_299831 [Trichonephila inaurata madagascariensis]